MTSSIPHRFIPLIIVSVLSLALIAGCKPAPETPQPTESSVPPTAAPTPEPTVVSQKLILVDPNGTGTSDITAYLSETSAANGLVFETTPAINPAELGDETRVVVFLSQPDNLQEIVSSAPQTQFIVAGTADPAGKSNLSVIKSQPQDLAFMSGYLSTLIAWDWRSAGLIPNDTALGASYYNAFENGGRYICGLCVPYYVPYYYFPFIVEESASAAPDAWLGLMSGLTEYYVDTVFVDPGIAFPDVLSTLSANEYTLVGNAGTSSPESFTVLLDYDLLPAFKELLPSALAGTGWLTIGAQIIIASYANDGPVTPAKIEAFNKVAADLAAGWIDPLSVP